MHLDQGFQMTFGSTLISPKRVPRGHWAQPTCTDGEMKPSLQGGMEQAQGARAFSGRARIDTQVFRLLALNSFNSPCELGFAGTVEGLSV